jgi:hypothetical protein
MTELLKMSELLMCAGSSGLDRNQKYTLQHTCQVLTKSSGVYLQADSVHEKGGVRTSICGPWKRRLALMRTLSVLISARKRYVVHEFISSTQIYKVVTRFIEEEGNLM